MKALRLTLLVAGLVFALGALYYTQWMKSYWKGGATPKDLERLATKRAAEWPKYDEKGFERMKPPVEGEWLFRFPEKGQTFDEYLEDKPNKSAPGHNTIYLRPLGPLSPRSKAALAAVASFTRAFFQVETKVLPEEPIFADALVKNRRENDQYDCSKITDHLAQERPEDALIYAGIADQDLFSGDLNFVFGVGSFHQRVGVYSFVRFAEPSDPLGRIEKNYRRRAFQLVAHELGHMFTLNHCIFYMCEQNGSLSLYESDHAPSHACPVCLKKLQWNVGFDVKKRYADLAAVYKTEGLDDDARFCEERSK
jgi:archaemetzincin